MDNALKEDILRQGKHLIEKLSKRDIGPDDKDAKEGLIKNLAVFHESLLELDLSQTVPEENTALRQNVTATLLSKESLIDITKSSLDGLIEDNGTDITNKNLPLFLEHFKKVFSDLELGLTKTDYLDNKHNFYLEFACGDFSDSQDRVTISSTRNNATKLAALKFKVNKYQGDSEKGQEGFDRLMALKDAIVEVERMLLHMDPKTYLAERQAMQSGHLKHTKFPVELESDFSKSFRTFNTSIDSDTDDEVTISHNSRVSTRHDESVNFEDLKFSVGKFQGDCEVGSEGFRRLVLMKEMIEQSEKLIAVNFPNEYEVYKAKDPIEDSNEIGLA
jgi:hypothetical protein